MVATPNPAQSHAGSQWWNGVRVCHADQVSPTGPPAIGVIQSSGWLRLLHSGGGGGRYGRRDGGRSRVSL